MLRIALLAITASIFGWPTLVHAQDVQHPGYASSHPRPPLVERAVGYDPEAPARRPRGWEPPPQLRGWRYRMADGLRERLQVEDAAVAAENARRDREAGDLETPGMVLLIAGLGGVAAGGASLFAGLVSAIFCNNGGGCGGPGPELLIGGGVTAGLGVLSAITGGVLLSIRPSHLEPGEVTLTLGPGSLEVMW